MILSFPEGTKTYSISLTDPTGISNTVTFAQTSAATPSVTLDTDTATPGTQLIVGLTRNNLNTAAVSSVFVYNTLNPDNLDEIASGDIASDSSSIEFPYTFRTGQYGFKIWYEGYGWA